MYQRMTVTPATPFPLRPLRIVIEDPALLLADVHPAGAFEITMCSGPCEGDVCPLVMDGSCPLGPCDLVVSALEGPWAHSVHAAWEETGTPVVDARGVTTEDPEARVAHHVGAALQRLLAAYASELHGEEDDGEGAEP